ncbi:MAG: hypothetical protein HQL42_02085 [Alphaproteobacteria bacterium]|nr:hypothetical protein [Alphaproteobacteria bacterium]
MTKSKRNFLVWSVTVSCIAWMAVVGWLLFVMMPASVEHHSSAAVKDRMATQCQGSFKDRYECKEAIIVESGRDTFWTMAGRFLAVVVPPMLLSAWLSSYLKRNPIRLHARHIDEGGDWKSRAQMHTKAPAPPPGHAGGFEPDEEMPQKSYSLDDIAPVDDWKTRAQNKTRHPPK